MKLQLHVQFLDDRIVPSAVQLTDDPTAAHPGSTSQNLDVAVAVDCGCPGNAVASLRLEHDALAAENATIAADTLARLLQIAGNESGNRSTQGRR